MADALARRVTISYEAFHARPTGRRATVAFTISLAMASMPGRTSIAILHEPYSRRFGAYEWAAGAERETRIRSQRPRPSFAFRSEKGNYFTAEHDRDCAREHR